MRHRIHDRRADLPAGHMRRIASTLESAHRVQRQRVQIQTKLAQARTGAKVKSDIRRHRRQTTIAMDNHI